jgi:hypothetical protein
MEISLSIVEPWEFATQKAVEATIIEKYDEVFLICLKDPLLFDNINIRYLLCEFRVKKEERNVLEKHKKYLLNMVFSEKINLENFTRFKLEDFRSGFLLGEMMVK